MVALGTHLLELLYFVLVCTLVQEAIFFPCCFLRVTIFRDRPSRTHQTYFKTLGRCLNLIAWTLYNRICLSKGKNIHQMFLLLGREFWTWHCLYYVFLKQNDFLRTFSVERLGNISSGRLCIAVHQCSLKTHQFYDILTFLFDFLKLVLRQLK